jgi:hypothetical protein
MEAGRDQTPEHEMLRFASNPGCRVAPRASPATAGHEHRAARPHAVDAGATDLQDAARRLPQDRFTVEGSVAYLTTEYTTDRTALLPAASVALIVSCLTPGVFVGNRLPVGGLPAQVASPEPPASSEQR